MHSGHRQGTNIHFTVKAIKIALSHMEKIGILHLALDTLVESTLAAARRLLHHSTASFG